MEYSLYYLNKQANLKNLKITEIIDKLNLIGFEVDDIYNEPLLTNDLLNDTRLLIEIPSNRQDLLNEKFFLNEISTIFSVDIYKVWNRLQIKYSFLIENRKHKYINLPINQINSDLKDIVIYKFELENCFTKKSPQWIQQKLKNRGVSPLNDLNDFLNLITVEYGTTILSKCNKDNKSEFVITRLQISENFENFEIPAGSIVLKNKIDEIVSVLGFVNFNEPNKSGQVSLEAYFYDIYSNVNKLNTINTKLSFKYLRSMFIENFGVALKRVLSFLEFYNSDLALVVVASNQKAKLTFKNHKTISLSKNLLRQVLNITNFDYEIFKKANLKIIGETNNNFYIQILAVRKDLNREIDLIEEYSRFVGYKNFQEILPKKSLAYSSKKLNNYKYIQNFLINYGFNEVFTNSLVNKTNQTDLFSIDLQNPLNKEINTLRTSLFPRLLEVMHLNLKSGYSNCNFFEIGRVFKKSNKQIIEQDKLGGIFQYSFAKTNAQQNINWFIVKGFLEMFIESFGYENLEIFELSNKTKYFHSTRSIQFRVKNKVLGTFGEVNPMLENFQQLKEPIFMFEFNLVHFKNWRMKSEIISYKDYSKYPSIVRDLSLNLNKKIKFSTLKQFIQETTKNLININFFDIYFDPISVDKVNIGVRLEFQKNDRTLTTLEIDNEISKLLKNLAKEFKIEM